MGSISTSTPSSLDTSVREAQQRYISNNPQSKKAHDDACQYLPGGNTRTVLYTTPFPLTFSSANSAYLQSADAHTLIDFLGEYTAGIYGHNHPVIRAAMDSALARGWNYAGMSGLETQLAGHICTRFPSMELIRFVNSGTEANMMALATAVAYTKKKTILLFTKGYHGSTIAGRPPSNKPTINLPHDFMLGTYNDVPGTEALISSLPPDSLAAILVEPMLGSGGCFTASPSFLHTLRTLATQHSALLIFDEVMTSRLTYHGLAATFPDITPDLMTLGKWVGGGMSFGAFGGRRDIMALYDPRPGQVGLEHPGTFNNNVFSMAAGIAGCEFLTPTRITALNTLGDEMREKVNSLLTSENIITPASVFPNTPVPDTVNDDPHQLAEKIIPRMFLTGLGSLMTMHFTGPDRAKLQSLFYHHMLEEGIYLAQRGFIALNVELTSEHVEKFISGVGGFVERYREFLS